MNLMVRPSKIEHLGPLLIQIQGTTNSIFKWCPAKLTCCINLSPLGAVSAAKTDNRRTLGITSINNYLRCSSSLHSFAIKELDYQGANVLKRRDEGILKQGE